MLDLPLLVAGAWVAEMAVEQIVAAEGGKGLLLDAPAASEDGLNGGSQIVVADALRDACKEAERLHVSREEGFLALGRKGHGEGAMSVAQADGEELNGALDPTQNDLGLAPISLGILTGVEFKREEGLGTALGTGQFANIAANARFTASVALSLKDLEDSMAGIALFAGLALTLGEQGRNAVVKRTELGGAARSGLGIGRRRR